MSTPLILCRLGGLLLLLLSTSAVSADNSNALQLLNKMSQASASLSYQGSFTYEHGSSLESFKVVRWMEDKVEYEHLEHLTGPAREVLRQMPAGDCLSAGGSLFQKRLAPLNNDIAGIDKYYKVVRHGQERVAGRETVVIQLVPKDQMRYGYVLSLDAETGLLLKSLLLDNQQRLMERFQFVSLELDPTVESPDPDGDQFQQGSGTAVCPDEAADSPRQWVMRWLPPGFEFSGEKRLEGDTDMLMYTDGLATFSVFIQPRDDAILVEGRAQRGATTAYMGAVSDDRQDYRLTVVGEVPSTVVEKLAEGLVARAGHVSAE